MWKFSLLIYFVLFWGAAFFGRSYLVWRATGRNPLVLDTGDAVHRYLGKLFRLSLVINTAVLVIYAASDTVYAYLVPIPWLAYEWLTAVGWGFMLVSLGWIMLAQKQMGASWRIGIDHEQTTPLITNGLFTRSRNPIFLGMIISLLGLFLVIPNAVTLLLLVTTAVLLQVQVLLEESYLGQVHGEAYQDYCRRVSRWL